jgi:hypothetical protein
MAKADSLLPGANSRRAAALAMRTLADNPAGSVRRCAGTLYSTFGETRRKLDL